MTPTLLEIENRGPEIIATNYFQSAYARRGALYLSVNASAFRLLVPPAQESAIAEMRTAREVIISRGPWPEANRADCFEILFDDHTDAPYSLNFGREQIDRYPAPSRDTVGQVFKGWQFSVWVAGPEGTPQNVWETKCFYRVVESLPCLRGLDG